LVSFPRISDNAKPRKYKIRKGLLELPSFLLPSPIPSTQQAHLDVTMNMIENQVTDLNYLAESPIALSGNMNGQRQTSSAESPAENGAGSGKKRTSDDMNGNNSGGTGATHTRAKRNRYISIAWYV